MSSTRPTQVLGLDVMRCLAAFLVMCFHYFGALRMWVPDSALASYDRDLQPYTWFGWVGVQIFFVISGFVIAYSASQATPASFARGRFLRLFPTLWICSTITLIVCFIDHTVPHHLLFVRWLQSVVLDPWNSDFLDSSYWTLPVEITFYGLIFSLLLLGAFRYVGQLVQALGLLSSVVLVSQFVRRVGLTPHLDFGDRLQGASGRVPLLYDMFRFGVYFALGTQLWLFLFGRRTFARAAMLGLFGLGGTAGVYLYAQNQLGLFYTTEEAKSNSPLWPTLIWAFSVILLVLSVLLNAKLTQALSPKFIKRIRQLGVATYPAYLLHQQIGHILILRLHGRLPDRLVEVSLLVLIPAISIVVIPNVEAPVQDFLRQKMGLSRKQTREPAAALP